MNEFAATKQGLQYTGHYSHDIEEVKTVAKKIRAEGSRAIVVTIPPNPLSRGYRSTGYSVYVEPKYHMAREANSIREYLATADAKRAALSAEYDKKYAELEEQITSKVHRLDELEAKVNA